MVNRTAVTIFSMELLTIICCLSLSVINEYINTERSEISGIVWNITHAQSGVYMMYTKKSAWDLAGSTDRYGQTFYLAVLTDRQLTVIDMSAYKVVFKKRRPGNVFEIQFDERTERLFWMSWGYPPSIGYFAGRSYKQIYVLKYKVGSGGVFAFGIGSDRYILYKAYYFHWAKEDGILHRMQTDYQQAGGPIMVNSRKRRIYAYDKNHFRLVEWDYAGKIVDRIDLPNKVQGDVRIAFDNKDTLYIPFPNGDLWRISVETWTKTKMNITKPVDLSIVTVRHDRMVLAGSKSLNIFDKHLHLIKSMEITLGRLMGAALMVTNDVHVPHLSSFIFRKGVPSFRSPGIVLGRGCREIRY